MTTHLDQQTLLAMSTDCACFNVRKAARALTAFYDQVIAPTGLRATQGTLLVALARAGDIPVTRLAGILGMDRTTLTRNLEPLERDGLVALRPGEDRRVRLAGITEKGRKALAAAMPLWREAQRQIAEGDGRGALERAAAGAGTHHRPGRRDRVPRGRARRGPHTSQEEVMIPEIPWLVHPDHGGDRADHPGGRPADRRARRRPGRPHLCPPGAE